MTIDEINALDDLYWGVLNRVPDGTEITFTEDNIYPYDSFLILGRHRKSIKVNIVWRGITYVYFDGVDPIRLEDCPDSFLKSLLLNVE